MGRGGDEEMERRGEGKEEMRDMNRKGR